MRIGGKKEETLENPEAESSAGSASVKESSRGSSEVVELSFFRTKKPARVAERNMRISLNGHICFFFFSFLDLLFPVLIKAISGERRDRGVDEERRREEGKKKER